LSSAQVEYMAINLARCEAIWLRKLLVALFRTELVPTVIHYDNQSYIKLFDNPMFHDRSKHIDIHYHHIDIVQRGIVSLQYVET